MNLPGSYKVEAYDAQTNSFQAASDLAIQITVDETFDNDHRVVTQTSRSSKNPSKFTFSAADSGLHRLCFNPSGPRTAPGWFSGGGADMGGIKLSLDLAIGATSKIESDDKGKIEGIVGKVKELNGRLMDIRREQVFQRVRSGQPPKWQLLRLASSPSNHEAGARSRIQRPERSHQCPSCSVDAHSAGSTRRHVRLATFSFTSIFHQAKAYIDSH